MVEIRWVFDTAPLVVAMSGADSFLGPKGRRALGAARRGRGRIAVPTVCLFEVAQLEERGKVKLHVPFDEWQELLAATPELAICSLDPEHVVEARALPELRDPSIG